MSIWGVHPAVGKAYAIAATQQYCRLEGTACLPETAWEWVHSSRALSRCATLKHGGLRVASPEPSDIVGVMLLAHELCHAALEWHAPGSLADTERTETFAIAGEVFTAQWLASKACPEQHNLALAQALTQWAQEREHEFGAQHAALSQFEWLLWVASKGAGLHTNRVAFVESAWQRAHGELGLEAHPSGWAVHPLIRHKPGTAHVYWNAWRSLRRAPVGC